jgi:broad specificity phosphatase PhoE
VVAPSLGEPAAWAAAIAARGSSALEHDDMLAASPANESLAGLAQRLLDALERALRDDPARVLLVMPRGLPALLAARALGMPLERAPALWVDPGRAVLLLHGRRGFALRRSNSPHPVADGEESP